MDEKKKKRKFGRKPYVRTPEHAAKVEAMSALGGAGEKTNGEKKQWGGRVARVWIEEA